MSNIACMSDGGVGSCPGGCIPCSSCNSHNEKPSRWEWTFIIGHNSASRVTFAFVLCHILMIAIRVTVYSMAQINIHYLRKRCFKCIQ